MIIFLDVQERMAYEQSRLQQGLFINIITCSYSTHMHMVATSDQLYCLVQKLVKYYSQSLGNAGHICIEMHIV